MVDTLAVSWHPFKTAGDRGGTKRACRVTEVSGLMCLHFPWWLASNMEGVDSCHSAVAAEETSKSIVTQSKKIKRREAENEATLE